MRIPTKQNKNNIKINVILVQGLDNVVSTLYTYNRKFKIFKYAA